jgi:hypothetical protein
MRISRLILFILVAHTLGFSALAQQNQPVVELTETPGPADASDLVGVDFKDVIIWARSRLPEAFVVLKELKKRSTLFLGPNNDGVNIHGVELLEKPLPTAHGKLLTIALLLQKPDMQCFFRKIEVEITKDSNGAYGIAGTRFLEDIGMRDVRFTMKVGLVQRKAILEDQIHGLKIVYPLGVGGLDEITHPGRPMILTPSFSNGALEKRYVIAERNDPPYFKGKPFIRLSNSNGYLPVGFHIQQNPVFVRGFDSHGCMRLREKDLTELFLIVTRTDLDETPLAVFKSLPDGLNHPYPLHTQYYKRIKNFGTPEKPLIKRDEEGLIIMERVYKPAPIEQFDSETGESPELSIYMEEL